MKRILRKFTKATGLKKYVVFFSAQDGAGIDYLVTAEVWK